MDAGIIFFQGNLEELKTEIKHSYGLVIIYFFASWCELCQNLNNSLPSLTALNKDITIIKVDVDKNGQAAEHFGVTSIPHLVYIKSNNTEYEILDHQIGGSLQDITANIEKYK